MSQQPNLIDYGQTQETTDDYYTPAAVFEALGLTYDLDVCAPPGGVSWVPASRYFTKEDDGLAQQWFGRVWMNPPYSRPSPWVSRFIAHGHGIALLPHAKSAWYVDLWASGAALATPSRFFPFVGGQIFMPTVFAAFGDECVEALARVGVVRIRA